MGLTIYFIAKIAGNYTHSGEDEFILNLVTRLLFFNSKLVQLCFQSRTIGYYIMFEYYEVGFYFILESL